MMKLLTNLWVILLMTVVYSVSGQTKVLKPATIVHTNPTDAQILEAIGSTGLTLSNPQLIYGNRAVQIVTFKDGRQANFGFDDGIFISTGSAKADILSNNNEVTKSEHFFIPPNNASPFYEDYDLQDIEYQARYKPFVYSFNVKLDKGITALRIAFQFGSEEYPDYVGAEYNDAFGFFVDGPGLPPFNMAKLPTTQKPISVRTVNSGIKGSHGGYDNNVDLTQSDYYINNGHTTQTRTDYDTRYVVNTHDKRRPRAVFVEWNGLTKLITYDLTGLIPGENYYFKIAIADTKDPLRESGVIIEKLQGVAGADLAILKEVDQPETKAGEIVEFKLTASNLGPYKSDDVIVEDLLPSGYEFISASNTTGTYTNGLWSIGLMNVGQKETLTIKAKVKKRGDYTNTASIKSSLIDLDLSNNTSTVTPQLQYSKKNKMISNPMIHIYNK